MVIKYKHIDKMELEIVNLKEAREARANYYYLDCPTRSRTGTHCVRNILIFHKPQLNSCIRIESYLRK